MALNQELLRTYLELENAKKDLRDPKNISICEELKSKIELLSQALESLENKHTEEYRKVGFKPTIGDGRYYKFPDKNLIDDLRVKHCEKTGKDLSISYSGIKAMFGNDMHLYARTYRINGKTPYRLMIGQGLTISVTINVSLLYDIELLVRFIEEHTGNPVNFIYSDNSFQEVSFARIGNEAFYEREGRRDYYRFFYELYDAYGDDYIKNVIYVGPEMQSGVPTSEIERTNNKLILPNRLLAAEKNKDLDSFNKRVKSKILSI